MTENVDRAARLHAAVERYWETAEARDWPAFGALLTGDVVYDLPQTRERIVGRDAYLRFNEDYPGDWHASVHRVVAEETRAACWIRMVAGGETADAVMFFEADEDGLISRVTDFWPEPYEPPAGREHLVERY